MCSVVCSAVVSARAALKHGGIGVDVDDVASCGGFDGGLVVVLHIHKDVCFLNEGIHTTVCVEAEKEGVFHGDVEEVPAV